MSKIEDQDARAAIDGAIAFGRMGVNEPPAGHWLTEYWSIGRQLAELGKTSAWDNQTPVESRPTPEQSRDENCGNCHTCAPITMDNMRMILCEVCGNKRCPHANDHRNVCTGSNEPGQPGSAYPASRGDEAERSALGREG